MERNPISQARALGPAPQHPSRAPRRQLESGGSAWEEWHVAKNSPCHAASGLNIWEP